MSGMETKEIILAGFDPGKINFAYSIVSSTRGVIESGYVNVLESLNKDKLTASIEVFAQHITQILTKYPLDCVVVERFQIRPGRGGAKGAVGEYINFMLGQLAFIAHTHGLNTNLFTAALWKRYMLNNYGSHEMEKVLLKTVSIHEADSIGMIITYLELYGGHDRGSMLSIILGKEVTVKTKKVTKKKAKKKTKLTEAEKILKEAVKQVKQRG